jgi:HTH-type transcriptional regulator / antitoxin HigA
MKLKPIKNNKEYELMLDWVDQQLDEAPKPTSEEGVQLQIALLFIKSYEDEFFPVPVPNAIDAIRLKMQEKGLRNKDLADVIGSKGYISAILNKRKPYHSSNLTPNTLKT